jgi:hypothetical protein
MSELLSNAVLIVAQCTGMGAANECLAHAGVGAPAALSARGTLHAWSRPEVAGKACARLGPKANRRLDERAF